MRGAPRPGQNVEKRLRVNERIRTPEVRLIGDDGEQLGVVTVTRARELAKEKELDLVEVSPTAVPPVCKLMNYGKYTYQLNKKAQDARRHQTRIQVKEVKFRPKIDEHDYNFKKNNAVRFLQHGDKVKATIMFRGREIVHTEYGRRILTRLLEDVADIAICESSQRQEGNTLHMILAPKKGPEPTRTESSKPERAARPEPTESLEVPDFDAQDEAVTKDDSAATEAEAPDGDAKEEEAVSTPSESTVGN